MGAVGCIGLSWTCSLQMLLLALVLLWVFMAYHHPKWWWQLQGWLQEGTVCHQACCSWNASVLSRSSSSKSANGTTSLSLLSSYRFQRKRLSTVSPNQVVFWICCICNSPALCQEMAKNWTAMKPSSTPDLISILLHSCTVVKFLSACSLISAWCIMRNAWIVVTGACGYMRNISQLTQN